MKRIPVAPLVAALFGVAACAQRGEARADDFVVYSPYVTQGQTEFEVRGYQQQDTNLKFDARRAYELSVAHAFTSWWRPEIYVGEYKRAPGKGQQRVGNEFENIFQLTPQGEYWADAGFLLSYEYMTQPGVPNALEFGPLFEKRSGRFDQRLNLIWEKEIGPGADNKYALRTAYQMTYSVTRTFAPGFEAYIRPNDDANQIGPIVAGELASTNGSELEYRFGVVFGLNAQAPAKTFLAKLEYEFY